MLLLLLLLLSSLMVVLEQDGHLGELGELGGRLERRSLGAQRLKASCEGEKGEGRGAATGVQGGESQRVKDGEGGKEGRDLPRSCLRRSGLSWTPPGRGGGPFETPLILAARLGHEGGREREQVDPKRGEGASRRGEEETEPQTSSDARLHSTPCAPTTRFNSLKSTSIGS